MSLVPTWLAKSPPRLQTAQQSKPSSLPRQLTYPSQHSADDILHSDEHCVVLKPDSSRGVLVRTYQDKNIDVLSTGIYSNRKALEMGFTERNRPYLNDVVFFRPPRQYPYDDPCNDDSTMKCYELRVDPEKTWVYDQEYHARWGTTQGEPSMLLSDYLKMLESIPKGNSVMWHSFDRCEPYTDEQVRDYYRHMYNSSRSHSRSTSKGLNIHYMFEVRVKMDVIPPWFLIPSSTTTTQKWGGYAKPQGRKHAVYVGPRGGHFILTKGKNKKYITNKIMESRLFKKKVATTRRGNDITR